jgi:hypothetical protein
MTSGEPGRFPRRPLPGGLTLRATGNALTQA